MREGRDGGKQEIEMIIQISDDDSIVLKCLAFDGVPEAYSFFIRIYDNYLYICRNGGEEMKIHPGKPGERLLPYQIVKGSKEKYLKAIKSKPLETGSILIKLEKE